MIEADPNYVYSPASGKMILSRAGRLERAKQRAARYRDQLKTDPAAWAEAQRKIRAWHEANKDRVREHKRRSRIKPCSKERRKAYHAKIKDRFKVYQKSYIARNPDKRKASLNRYNKTPKARVAAAIRARLRFALKSKKQSTRAYLGCTPQFFKQHIEAQFSAGMTWENFGKWHMDHIVPLSAFDLSDLRQVQIACNWTNIRPLWAKANLRKSSKVTHPQMSLPLTVS